MSQVPSISVVMSVFNAGKYLASAVESVLSQTWRDFEFIILDDGSTDGSRKLLEAMARNDDRIRLFVEKNEGLVARLNQGVMAARGQWIARMDADDICMPTRFEAQAKFLETHHDHAAVGCGFEMIDPDGDVVAQGHRPLVHEEIDAWHMMGKGGGIMHPAAMLRTSMVRKVGGYRKEFVVAQDVDLFLRLAEVGKLANLSESLLRYRLHTKSVSYQKTALQVRLLQTALKEACQRRGIASPSTTAVPDEQCQNDLAAAHHYWADMATKAGHHETAIKHAWRAALASPFNLRYWSLLRSLLTSKTEFALPNHIRWSWITRIFAIVWARILQGCHGLQSQLRRILARCPVFWRLVVAPRPDVTK